MVEGGGCGGGGGRVWVVGNESVCEGGEWH